MDNSYTRNGIMKIFWSGQRFGEHMAHDFTSVPIEVKCNPFGLSTAPGGHPAVIH